MGALGTSLVIQIGLAAFVVIVPLLFPQQVMPRAMYMVTEIEGPPLEIPKPPAPKPPVARVKVTPPPKPMERTAPNLMLRSSSLPRLKRRSRNRARSMKPSFPKSTILSSPSRWS